LFARLFAVSSPIFASQPGGKATYTGPLNKNAFRILRATWRFGQVSLVTSDFPVLDRKQLIRKQTAPDGRYNVRPAKS
jgi:hypothetical protein